MAIFKFVKQAGDLVSEGLEHAANVAAETAEVNLHVDDQEGSCLRVERATARPGVGERLHFLLPLCW